MFLLVEMDVMDVKPSTLMLPTLPVKMYNKGVLLLRRSDFILFIAGWEILHNLFLKKGIRLPITFHIVMSQSLFIPVHKHSNYS